MEEIGDEIIGSDEAARIASLSQNHIRHLLRTGKISGKKIGPRLWVTTREQIERYLASEPRPGPKSKDRA